MAETCLRCKETYLWCSDKRHLLNEKPMKQYLSVEAYLKLVLLNAKARQTHVVQLPTEISHVVTFAPEAGIPAIIVVKSIEQGSLEPLVRGINDNHLIAHSAKWFEISSDAVLRKAIEAQAHAEFAPMFDDAHHSFTVVVRGEPGFHIGLEYFNLGDNFLILDALADEERGTRTYPWDPGNTHQDLYSSVTCGRTSR